MGGMKVPELDFVRLLPAFMRDDEAAIALSKAMNQLIGEPGKRLHTIRTWDKIDELNEAECDELAWELDIDWYDSTGMGLDEKRATIKLAQQIKRKRGTKWSVERLISAYFGEGYVMEWYDIDSKPYTFVALTTNTHITAENYAKFVEAVKAAKNVRSRLLGVFYFWKQGPENGISYALGSSLHRYEFKKCGTSPRKAVTGFVVKGAVETEPETTHYKYAIEKCCERKARLSLRDIVTGKLYFLYVEAGRLNMSPGAGRALRDKIVFDDRETGENFKVYVESGKLKMEQTYESEAEYEILFDDQLTGEQYSVYVEAGKLRMALVCDATIGNDFLFDDRKTGENYRVYVEAGKLRMTQHYPPRPLPDNVVFDDQKTGDNYSVYVEAGKLSMEPTQKTPTETEHIIDDKTTGENYGVYVESGKLKMAEK